MSNDMSLRRIWSMTDGIRAETFDREKYIFLRVRSTEMPATYLSNDMWFFLCKSLKPGWWEVGLRSKFLDQADPQDKKSVEDICAHVQSMENMPGINLHEWHTVNQAQDITKELLSAALERDAKQATPFPPHI